MLAAYPLTALFAPPHFHRVALHIRLRGRRHIRHGCFVGPLIAQFASAARALTESHRYFDRWLTARMGRSLPECEGALSRFASRLLSIRLGFWLPVLRFPSGRFQLSAEPLVFPPQALDLSFGLLHTIAQNLVFLL